MICVAIAIAAHPPAWLRVAPPVKRTLSKDLFKAPPLPPGPKSIPQDEHQEWVVLERKSACGAVQQLFVCM